MNCKRQLTQLICASLLFLCTQAIFAEPDAEPDAEENLKIKHDDGRFKIFIAEHDIVLKGKSKVIKSIFKMDKMTGIVWRYRQGVDSKGKMFEEFFEVPNQ